MKTINVSEATVPALNWLVAKCEHPKTFNSHRALRSMWAFRYSTDWATGGPIIEREQIAVWPDQNGCLYYASADQGRGKDHTGPTLLVAAMRCYVISKLGETVEVPEGLT